MMVGPGIKTGINIKYDNPRELGSDRIANAVAAYELYGGPCIFIDFGTATSFGVVSHKGEFLGGAISPGIKLSAEALVEKAAKLPRFELQRPDSVIGRNTITNLQSGIVYGHVGLVTYLIRKMKQELGAPQAKVIATGGMALLVSGGNRHRRAGRRAHLKGAAHPVRKERLIPGAKAFGKGRRDVPPLVAIFGPSLTNAAIRCIVKMDGFICLCKSIKFL